MNRSAIMKNKVHEDDDDVQAEKHLAHSEGADDSDEDYVYCLSSIFPNTDDDPVEYVYTRDTTGRVVSMETHLKVPRNEEAVMETSDKAVVSFMSKFVSRKMLNCVSRNLQKTIR